MVNTTILSPIALAGMCRRLPPEHQHLPIRIQHSQDDFSDPNVWLPMPMLGATLVHCVDADGSEYIKLCSFPKKYFSTKGSGLAENTMTQAQSNTAAFVTLLYKELQDVLEIYKGCAASLTTLYRAYEIVGVYARTLVYKGVAQDLHFNGASGISFSLVLAPIRGEPVMVHVCMERYAFQISIFVNGRLKQEDTHASID